MGDQQLRAKQPRKILGGLCATGTTRKPELHSNNNTNTLAPPATATPLLPPIGNNSSVANTYAALQQQQMERIRLMSQEMHAMWPYGAATFLSPILPAPYALAGTLVPIYQPTAAALPNQNSNAAQQQQQQQQQQCLPIGNNNNNSMTSNSAMPSSTASTSSCNSNSSGASSASCSNTKLGSMPTTGAATATHDANKINIQIGLQCVSQNMPMNFNTMNELNGPMAKVNLLNFCSGAEKDFKDSSSSLRSSPIPLGSDDLINSPVGGGGGDATNSPDSNGGGSVTLSQAKFNELTRLALRGSEIAEKLAYTHRNRPCFKKIDSLCARMKQDLIRPDGVLPNINSQGIAWAVKDFIFVFTRVINAWIIIKGYVYNMPEGLNKVKSALSPEFAASFAVWQDTTMDFVENLIKSFVNLDNLVQSQKNVYQKSDNVNGTGGSTAGSGAGGGTTSSSAGGVATSARNSVSTPIKLQPSNSILDDTFDFLNTSVEKSQQCALNKNYLYTMVEDSEGSQRQATVNGTYFKTGTYNPIKKDAALLLESERTAAAAALALPALNVVATTAASSAAVPSAMATTTNALGAAQHLLGGHNPLESYFHQSVPDFLTSAEVQQQPTMAQAPLASSASTASAAACATFVGDYLQMKEKLPVNWLNYDIRVLEQNLTEFSKAYDPTAPPRPLGKDLIDKLNILIERLMTMKHADLFFKLQFTKNYFPDFVAKYKHDFMDVRSIILKCQVGGYQHLFEVVHDIKRIIYFGKEFLKRKMDATFQKSLIAFETEFNKLLAEPPFENYQFDHISGEPMEILYNSRNN